MRVIVETPPPMLNKLPQLLIQVPAWLSLSHWQPGSTSPTSSVLEVPSVASAMRMTEEPNEKIPETCPLFVVWPKRTFPPGSGCSKTLKGWQIDRFNPSTFCAPSEPP